jgi:hypothetical protein
VADFNGDGHLDLALTGYGNGAVSILLGQGDGSFLAPQSYPVGNDSRFVVVGDFNGDGHPDLVVGGLDSNNNGKITVLLGKGDGSFQAGQSYDVGFLPTAVVGDFNSDGQLDLAVFDAGAFVNGTVRILLGNGDGSFQATQSYDIGFRPGSVVVGDFDNDGHLDLAVEGLSGVDEGEKWMMSLLLGKGDGSFQAAQSYDIGPQPTCLIVGDFNRDGNLDLALAHPGSSSNAPGTLSVLLGKGNGTFQPAQGYEAGYNPRSVTVGDFNGDGFQDLAVAGEDGVTVLLNAADWGPGMAPPGR